MEQPVLPPHYTTRSKLQLPLILLVLIGLAGSAIFATYYLSRQSTDTRSKATVSNAAGFQLSSREEGNDQIVDVYVDTTNLQNATIRSYDLSLTVEATTSAVLGITTNTSSFAEKDSQDHINKRVTFSSPSQRNEARKTKVCLDDIKVSGTTLTWTSPCKGDKEKGNCTPQTITLSTEEKARYNAWLALRKPNSSKCIFLDPPSKAVVVAAPNQPTSIPPVRPTATPVGVVASPSITPSSAPIASSQPTVPPVSLEVAAENSALQVLVPTVGFSQQKPTISSSEKTGNYEVHLQGAVANSQQAVALRGRFLVASLRLHKSASAPFFRVVINGQSLRGFTPLAPGTEVNLLSPSPTPTVTKSPESSEPPKATSSASPVGSLIPRASCLPRPACLDTTPRCMIAEPAEGWCVTSNVEK